jgi:pyruvate-ferredoxin/flavodoxin oxidoreductase
MEQSFKATIKIICNETDFHGQGTFVYNVKKSDGITISHLCFVPNPITSNYLITSIDYISVHSFGFP